MFRNEPRRYYVKRNELKSAFAPIMFKFHWQGQLNGKERPPKQIAKTGHASQVFRHRREEELTLSQPERLGHPGG